MLILQLFNWDISINFTFKYTAMLTTGQSCNSFFSTWNLSSQQRKSQRYWFKTCKLRKCVFTEGIDLEKWEVLISLFVKCYVSTRSISFLPGNLRLLFQNPVQTIKHKQIIQCTCPVNFELPQKRQRDLVNQHVLNVGIFAKEEKLSIFFSDGTFPSLKRCLNYYTYTSKYELDCKRSVYATIIPCIQGQRNPIPRKKIVEHSTTLLNVQSTVS